MSTSKKRLLLQVAALCGVVTPVIAVSAILLSIAYSPWFSWTQNALSDLGVHEAAAIFNSSLITSGVLTLVFALGLAQTLRHSRIAFAGALLLILTGINLSAIGFFPETAGRIHGYVSIAFFTLATLSMLVIGVSLIRKPAGRKIGAFSLSAGVFETVVWIVFWNLPIKGVAITEMLTSLSMSAWSVIMGVRLFTHASKS